MTITELLTRAIEEKASDVFFVTGHEPAARCGSRLVVLDDERLLPDRTRELIEEIYRLADRGVEHLENTGDDDFSFGIPHLSRFRVSTYRQRGTFSAVVRIISFSLPNPAEVGIPDAIMNLANYSKGMVLVTGQAGSGKSTTLACLIDRINKTRESHIITLEDPLEYLHRHDKSIVSQREIAHDTKDYVTALRAALRQSPDVILLGEMRDLETIQVVMTAAETGHLLFSSLHSVGAANTIDRIIDVFPAEQKNIVAVQLSMLLNAVVSQQLVPDVNGNLIPAFELMTMTPAIRNMIRENKIPQLSGIVYSSSTPDTFSMDSSLLKLYQAKRITKETALRHATNPDMLSKRLM